MCIVIDINALSMVFSEENDRHKEFSLVKRWIEEKRGVVVYGGSKYKTELAKTIKFARLLRVLRDAGKAVAILDSVVDQEELNVRRQTQNKGCDDPHIIALQGTARCPLLCSVDYRSFQFVKDRRLYPSGAPAVKIYSSKRNRKLLKNADPACLKNIEA